MPISALPDNGLLEKFFAELRESSAVGHIGNEHGHGDDVVQLAAGFSKVRRMRSKLSRTCPSKSPA